MSFISPFVGSGLGSPSGAGGDSKPAAAAATTAAPAPASGGGFPFFGAAGAGGDKSQVAMQTLNTFFGPSDGDQYGNNAFSDFINLGQSIAAATANKNG